MKKIEKPGVGRPLLGPAIRGGLFETSSGPGGFRCSLI